MVSKRDDGIILIVTGPFPNAGETESPVQKRINSPVFEVLVSERCDWFSEPTSFGDLILVMTASADTLP